MNSKLSVVFGLSEKECPEIEILGLDSTFSEVCVPILRTIKEEFLNAVNQWYDETEPEDFDIDEFEVEERVLFDDVDFII